MDADEISEAADSLGEADQMLDEREVAGYA